MLKQVEIVKEQYLKRINEVNSLADLEKVRVEFLGKKGLVTALMPLLKEVPNEQKREMGQAINALKNLIESSIADKKSELEAKELEKKIPQTKSKGVRAFFSYSFFKRLACKALCAIF